MAVRETRRPGANARGRKKQGEAEEEEEAQATDADDYGTAGRHGPPLSLLQRCRVVRRATLSLCLFCSLPFFFNFLSCSFLSFSSFHP